MILPKKFRAPGYFHDLLDQSLPGTVIGMGFACKDELYRIFRIIHDPSKSVYIREQKMSLLYVAKRRPKPIRRASGLNLSKMETLNAGST